MQTIFIITIGFLIGMVLKICGIDWMTDPLTFAMWCIPLNIINVIIATLIFNKI